MKRRYITLKKAGTIEEFVENYIENKKKAGPNEGYREWVVTNGIDSSKAYRDAVKDISLDYNKAKSEYGTRAERLGSLGLSASGYSDYLGGVAYSEMQRRKQSAKEDYAENEMKNLSGYSKYLKEKSNEKAKLYDNVVSEITASKIIDYDKAYEYALNSGLDEENAASAAKRASDAAHKNLREEVLHTIVVRNFEDSQAREYALAMGLGEYEADELAEYAFRINQAAYYSSGYLEYLESHNQSFEYPTGGAK